MHGKLATPIFYDPQRRRWQRCKRLVQFSLLGLSIVFATFVARLVVSPSLTDINVQPAKPNIPHPSLPQPRSSYPDRELQKAEHNLTSTAKKTQVPTSSMAPEIDTHQKSERIGFYVNWDAESFASLRQNVTRLDKLIPQWLHITSADGAVRLDKPSKHRQVLAYVRTRKPNLPIVPLVDNFNSERMKWEGAEIAAMLTNSIARAHVIEHLLKFVRAHDFAGINIDFEDVPASAQGALETFMRELYTRFHALGLEVSESVPLNSPKIDYRELARWNDYLILMAYDQHWSTGRAGPLASQQWYTAGLKQRFSELSPKKCVIGIGNYGLDWKAGDRRATETTFQRAQIIAQNLGKTIKLDRQSLNPSFNYYDNERTLHHVWFLDAVTAFNQIVEGQHYRPRGFALWRLGAEDPAIWSAFHGSTQLDRAVATRFQVLRYDDDVVYEGRGEIMRVTEAPRVGSRRLIFNEKSGLITAERFVAYAHPYVISRWGRNSKKKIALTFDDGPDSTYTPKILDVLHRYHVPATFFVIGANAMGNLDLLQRIVDEGHELGVHTFTHPAVTAIGPEQLTLQVNATQRLFESELGLRSLLFRPPYGIGLEPKTFATVQPMVLTSRLGYYNVGMHIDPEDWTNPGVEHIVKKVIDGAIGGAGNIVLLHDSGGDRFQTVKALPLIIKQLRARDFKLVSISNLLGLPRAEIMPKLPRHEQFEARITEVGFLLLSWCTTGIFYLFAVGILLSVLRFLCIVPLAVSEWRKNRHCNALRDFLPSVAVVVPAYNEEKVICQTIRALLASDHSNLTITIVDDGSSDETSRVVRESFGHDRRVQLHTRPNYGKARALNFGIQRSQAQIVVLLDADTVFRPNTISKLIGHFADPEVGAVAGNAKVGNLINVLTKWQALEYITSQNIERRACAALNCISVVPGAVGAWRRNLVLRAGGFTEETLAEDSDMALTILRMGYRINYEDQAIAFTEAPETLRGFLKQRFRWMYGSLQAAWKHLDTLFRRRYRALGMFAIPNVLVFQVFLPLIAPFLDLYVVLTVITMVWELYGQPPQDHLTIIGSFGTTLAFYACFFFLGVLTSCIAFLLERTEDRRLLIWLIPQQFVYRHMMYYVAVKSTATALRGTIVRWAKLDRNGTALGGNAAGQKRSRKIQEAA
jgi:cellulose synthase/poly-beta-1,6-N-acetylglucosamine synthase-like glycosyltransferase/peptidoglycan/xylan/chitin deacetylase (PgdA/CDA1 family)/spore germination protein YaaH